MFFFTSFFICKIYPKSMQPFSIILSFLRNFVCIVSAVLFSQANNEVEDSRSNAPGAHRCCPSNSGVTRVQYEVPYSEFMSAQWWHMDACSHAPLDPWYLGVCYLFIVASTVPSVFISSVRIPVVIGFCPRILLVHQIND